MRFGAGKVVLVRTGTPVSLKNSTVFVGVLALKSRIFGPPSWGDACCRSDEDELGCCCGVEPAKGKRDVDTIFKIRCLDQVSAKTSTMLSWLGPRASTPRQSLTRLTLSWMLNPQATSRHAAIIPALWKPPLLTRTIWKFGFIMSFISFGMPRTSCLMLLTTSPCPNGCSNDKPICSHTEARSSCASCMFRQSGCVMLLMI
mmetsp:Transcript_11933/g.22766  ORF Transcript_11933/g.22766 Transcript_11933/m.22766 type:complete len:201 (-) Transcript_11933:13-615(-)